jgi:hypothetical protein
VSGAPGRDDDGVDARFVCTDETEFAAIYWIRFFNFETLEARIR